MGAPAAEIAAAHTGGVHRNRRRVVFARRSRALSTRAGIVTADAPLNAIEQAIVSALTRAIVKDLRAPDEQQDAEDKTAARWLDRRRHFQGTSSGNEQRKFIT